MPGGRLWAHPISPRAAQPTQHPRKIPTSPRPKKVKVVLTACPPKKLSSLSEPTPRLASQPDTPGAYRGGPTHWPRWETPTRMRSRARRPISRAPTVAARSVGGRTEPAGALTVGERKFELFTPAGCLARWRPESSQNETLASRISGGGLEWEAKRLANSGREGPHNLQHQENRVLTCKLSTARERSMAGTAGLLMASLQL